MNEGRIPVLSEQTANVVENIAFQVAENHGGKITVNHLTPYLPMSLDLIRSCLDNMVDGHSVTTGEDNGFPTYEFSAGSKKTEEKNLRDTNTCVSCNADIPEKRQQMMLCDSCSQGIEKELNRLAEATGWPAKAIYEHEILYIAAKRNVPHHAPELAGHSRYTLKRMQRKLKAMTLERFLRQDIDSTAATITYHFPEISYPKASYLRNMDVIRRHPASLMEDMQLKVTRIILRTAALLSCVFILALLRIPLPFLLLCFFVIAPIWAVIIWRHKDRPPEE